MTSNKESEQKRPDDKTAAEKAGAKKPPHKLQQAEGEIGGPRGLEPTRYGDWERKGIVSDF